MSKLFLRVNATSDNSYFLYKSNNKFNSIISFFISFILGLYYTLKYFKIEFDYLFAIKSIIASILMSVVIILINPQGLSEVAIAIVVSVIVYLFFILLLKGINQDEINFLKKMIKYN